jgi:hypothetical protein
MEEMRNASKIVVRKHEWKIPFEKPRRKWNYNIEVDLKAGYEDVHWIHLAQVANFCEYGKSFFGFRKRWDFCEAEKLCTLKF